MKQIGKCTWVVAAAALLAAGFSAGGCTGRPPAGDANVSSARRRPTTQPATRPPTTTTAPATASAPVVRAVHVFISGRVQGVGFRAFTTRSARTLGLTGWVMNLRDGRVEAVIEGPADKVNALLEKLNTGPPSARVDDLKVTDTRPTGRFKDFEQRR